MTTHCDPPSSKEEEPTVFFGDERVPISDKRDRVADLFQRVAPNYDVMNDAMSLGWHRVWKRHAVARMGLVRGQAVLDVAAGTGDMTRLMAPKVLPGGRVCMLDLTPDMLSRGQERCWNAGWAEGVDTVVADATAMPFEDGTFDALMCAFGLRNMTSLSNVLGEMLRVLKPGGKLWVLEFSKPRASWLASCYSLYAEHVIPELGACLAGDRASYDYLVASIRRHPDQATLAGRMRAAGAMAVEVEDFAGGIVALHHGVKPA